MSPSPFTLPDNSLTPQTEHGSLHAQHHPARAARAHRPTRARPVRLGVLAVERPAHRPGQQSRGEPARTARGVGEERGGEYEGGAGSSVMHVPLGIRCAWKSWW